MNRAIIILSLAIVTIPSLAFAQFEDVHSTSQFYNAVIYVQEQEIVEGYSDGTYKPDNLINRAEFTKIIIGATFSSQAINNCIDKLGNRQIYTDISLNEWYSPYLCIATSNAIVKGYDDGTFHPADNINLAEASKIMFKAFTNNFDDTESNPWYRQYIEYLEQHAAIPTTILHPGQLITRGEMAEMIYRIKTSTTNKPTTSFFYNQPEQNNDFDLSINIKDKTLKVGDTVESAYYIGYNGESFSRALVLFRCKLIDGSYEDNLSIAPDDFVKGKSYNNGDISVVGPKPFELPGTYEYSISVYSCNEIESKTEYECDDTWGIRLNGVTDNNFSKLVNAIATVSENVTVSE